MGASENNRRARYYTLTAAGRVALEADAPPFDADSVCGIFSMTNPAPGSTAKHASSRR